MPHAAAAAAERGSEEVPQMQSRYTEDPIGRASKVLREVFPEFLVPEA